MTNSSKSLTVTAVMHQSGNITAFINELPGLMVQGSSEDDVKNKLGTLIGVYIKRLNARKHNIDIQTKCMA